MSVTYLCQSNVLNHLNRSEEPSFDNYVYCEKCCDFVFEYCSIHGPLLVVPDAEVSDILNYPTLVPRAADTIPCEFLHFAPSVIPGAGIGVFSTLTLPRGVRFGPYRGQRSNAVTSMYCWQIYDGERRPRHVVDAADGDASNWMRYVNCARRWSEQNMVAFQYQGQLYYRTVKTIPPLTELMVFCGSEYAYALNIDLKMYNFEPYYERITEASYHCHESTNLFKNTDMIADSINYSDQIDKRDGDARFEISNEGSSAQMLKYEFERCVEVISQIYKIQGKRAEGTKDCDVGPFVDIEGDSTQYKSPKMWKCEICLKILSNKTTRSRHYSTHDAELECPLCEFKTHSKIKFKHHSLQHKDTVFKCRLCDYMCIQKRYMRKHVLRHEKNDKIKN